MQSCFISGIIEITTFFRRNRRKVCVNIFLDIFLDIRGAARPQEWSVKGMANLHETQYFGRLEKEPENEAKRILMAVSSALREKGYNPVNQIVGYILSGDPTYITSYQNARVLIRKLERDELLEELVKDYLDRNE